MQAPDVPPSITLAINPTADVRFGVLGSLSATSSANASTVRIATPGNEPISESGRESLSQPTCEDHATVAIGVRERSPLAVPIKKQSSSVKLVFSWSVRENA